MTQSEFDFSQSDTCIIERDGFTITARLAPDSDHGAPWDECDGHGPVSEWREPNYMGRHDKRGGEVMLCGGFNESARFYDIREAQRIALRDGWGVTPPAFTYGRNAPDSTSDLSGWAQWQGGRYESDDISKAIGQAYAAHKATMTPRAYAALAARRDYDYLRAWCNDEWHYVGVVLSVARNGVTLDDHAASLWGIESNSGDYLGEVAADLLEEALDIGKAALCQPIGVALVEFSPAPLPAPRPAIAREFPEWPVGEIPPCPAGFVDSSWHNDACPSYGDEKRELTIYFDRIAPADRECPEFARFSLCDYSGTHLFFGDDWQGVIDAIATYDGGAGQ